jgi:hypothetical protein
LLVSDGILQVIAVSRRDVSVGGDLVFTSVHLA